MLAEFRSDWDISAIRGPPVIIKMSAKLLSLVDVGPSF